MMEQSPGAEKKVVAGVLAILLGGLGIHKFYLGYTTAGINHACCQHRRRRLHLRWRLRAHGIVGLIEGIIYLTKTDAEFVSTYITNKKEWF